MLTRLKVSGFKNLVDVDVRFGPFTCVAGTNGVGKSNLFDAIQFLSALADRPLMEAARSVRDKDLRTDDVRSLFHRTGNHYADRMSFEAEMIVPKEGIDDLGQEAKASSTLLRYTLILAYRSEVRGLQNSGSLEILKEELVRIPKGEINRHLLFTRSKDWQASVVVQSERRGAFISTQNEENSRIITLHSDRGSSGRQRGGVGATSRKLLANNLPRTVISYATAAEGKTAVLARREMQSWRLLQLEPTALRQPDTFSAFPQLGGDGSYLAATLYYLARQNALLNGTIVEEEMTRTYGQVANTLSTLLDDVKEISIDRDERRELLTLQVTGRDGTIHAAKALSDGTLRFLALAVLELDTRAHGLICLEEPENGIHPERIPAILKLLQAIATDMEEPVGSDNPLRQVIVNTHSPAVVNQVPEDSLLVAELKEALRDDQRFTKVCFSCLPDTWRAKAPEEVSIISKGKLLAYLNPVPLELPQKNGGVSKSKGKGSRRVIDRPDMQQLLLFTPGSTAE